MTLKTVESAQLKRINTFNKVGLKIQEEMKLEDIYHVIGKGLKEIRLDCAIMFLDEDQKNLKLKYTSSISSLLERGDKLFGAKLRSLAVVPMDCEDVAAVTAVKERRAVFTDRAADMVMNYQSVVSASLIRQISKIVGINYAILVPLIARGEVFGIFTVYSRELQEEEAPIVVAFANQAAIAIDNAVRLPMKFKKREKELAESEEKYRRLLEDINDGYVVLQDSNIVFANKKFGEIFGYRTEQLIECSIADFIAPDDLQEMMDLYMKVIGGEEESPERLELTAIKADGKIFPIEGGVRPTEYEGKPAFSVILRDITERKQTQEALQRSKEQFQALTENAFDTVVVVKADQTIDYVSPSIERSLGYTQEEFVTEKLDSRCHPDDLPGMQDTFNEVVQNPDHSVFSEIRVAHKDGSWRTIEGVANNLLDHPAVGGIVINFRDITERKLMEDDLRESNEIYNSLIETANKVHEGILIIQNIDNKEGVIVFVNDEITRNTGFSKKELIGMTVQQLLPPEDISKIMDRYRRRQGGEEQPSHYEMSAVRKDGTIFPIEIGIGLTTYQSKIASIAFIQDITERKQADEKLREYSENLERMVEERTRELNDAQEKIIRTEKLAAIGELAGSIAHELRNPLGAIKASTYYLKMKMRGITNEKLTKHMDILDKQADACVDIISDLLNFSRPGDLEIREVDIGHIVWESLHHTKVPKSVEVSTSLAKDIAPVMADIGHLGRVFSNLIANSIEAMHDGGKLLLITEQKGQFVEVKVTDTGTGISEEDLGKVFEPLFTTKAKGVGLGLSLSKALVERHGGTIEVQSQIGEGTTFTVEFPIAGDK